MERCTAKITYLVIITVVFRFKQDVGKTKDLAFNSKILLKSEILLKSNMIQPISFWKERRIETLPEIEKLFVHTNFHPLWSKYCLEIILKRSGLKFQDVMRIANQIEVKKYKIYVCMYSKLSSYKFPFFGIFKEIDLASLFTLKLQTTL